MNKDVIDFDEAIERVEDDIDLLIELLEVFLEDCPGKMKAMRLAAEQKDFPRLRDLAHSMKGAAANISVKKMREIFLAFENMGEEGALISADERFAELDCQLADLKEYYTQLKKKLSG